MKTLLSFNTVCSFAVLIAAISVPWYINGVSAQTPPRFAYPTSSQPLALSADDALLIVANPDKRLAPGLFARVQLPEGDAVKEVTMAKLATQRACFDVMDTCLQIHGGAGYMEEYEIERMARDARLGPIGGGTDEIMREILAKVLAL